jgi:hypothetical protein
MDPPGSQRRPRHYAVGDVINLVLDVVHLKKDTILGDWNGTPQTVPFQY